MTNDILKTLDELKQKLYHKIEDCLIEKGQSVGFFGYQTDIINPRLIVHKVYISVDDDNEQTVYVKYNMVGDKEEFVDELYCFTTDEMFNIFKNINNYEVE